MSSCKVLIMNSETGINDDLLIIRKTRYDDIPKIVDLQKKSFPLLAKIGNIWHPDELSNHLKIFPEGQIVADLNGEIIGSATSFIITLHPEYAEHTWKDITGNGMLTTHNPDGDSLYGADISTHPSYRHLGIGHKLYQGRKDITKKFRLRRMISGGRLFNYHEYSSNLTPLEYANKVIKGEIHDLVLSFDINNGFKFIKILPNYLDDERSLNYASFIEWINTDKPV